MQAKWKAGFETDLPVVNDLWKSASLALISGSINVKDSDLVHQGLQPRDILGSVYHSASFLVIRCAMSYYGLISFWLHIWLVSDVSQTLQLQKQTDDPRTGVKGCIPSISVGAKWRLMHIDAANSCTNSQLEQRSV